MYYSYRVKDVAGKSLSGVVEADNRNLVINNLIKQNYTILEIKEEKGRAEIKQRSLQLSFMDKVKVRDLSLFTRQLATMIASGLPIIRSFQILAEQSENRKLKQVAEDITQDLEGGISLHESMGKHGRVFSPMYISMVKAGEAGGVLDHVLQKLSEHLEREREINSKIKSASAYPAVVIVVAIAVVAFILTFVMPTFVESFASSGTELPAFTQFFLGISDFLRHNGLWLIIAIIAAFFALKAWGRQPGGRLFFDRLYLKLPLVGRTVNRVAVSRFTRTMSALTSSGVPIMQSLEVLEGVVGNKVLGNAIAEARESIKEGESISVPLARTGVFEPMVPQMIAVGEETGSLDEMLERMADFYDSEVLYAVDAMMSMLEPILIIFVAGIIGMIIIATYLPVFNIVSTIG